MAWSHQIQVPFTKTPYAFHLHGFCDLQLGSPSTSLSVIKTRIHEILNDPFNDPTKVDSGIIIPGDVEDEDRPSTRVLRQAAFAGRGEVVKRDAQKHMAYIDQKIIPILLPLQKTKYGIIGILAGHHWTQLTPVLNSAQYICQELTRISGKKVAYLGEMLSYLEFTFKQGPKSIKRNILVVHGEGSGQTKASSIQKLERLAQGFDADGYIRAHDTQLIATKTDKCYTKERRKDTKPEMMSRTIPYLNLGAATKSYDMDLEETSYAERALLRPNTLGWGTIKFVLRRAYAWEDRDHNIKCVMKVEI